MLEVTGIRHFYQNQPVLDLPQWRAEDGDQWLLHGPSGCGKTTLLHILGGLLTPSEGTVTLAGTNLGTLHGTARDRYRGQHIGIVFQQLHLIDAITVQQNLTLAQRFAGLPVDAARAIEILSVLGLADKAHAFPFALSHGQAQRVALARALINRPAVVLADEPTSNLDDDNAARALTLLRDQAHAHGSALVVASHDGRIKDAFEKRLELPPRREEAA